MTSDLLNVSVSGLKIAQSALRTTGHNISNAGVDGYSRQTVNSTTNPAGFVNGGYVGNGAHVESIDRQVNDFAIQQVRQDSSLSSSLNVYSDKVSQLDNLLSTSSLGLSSSMESFFASIQNGADDPTSIAARQLVISEAENLSDRFNAIHNRLDEITAGVNNELKTTVSSINALSSDIATLNEKISEALAVGGGAQPNDLLDQRDEAIRQLSEHVGLQVYDQGFGQVNIIIGNGQNLVIGNESFNLSLESNEANAADVDVVFNSSSSSQTVTNVVSGGTVGGLLEFRDDILEDVYNQLGRIAVVVSDTFNDAHSKGIDLDNNFGEDFFVEINNPEASSARVIGNANNSSSRDRELFLNISDSSVITTGDYTLKMEGNGLFTVTRESDNEVVVSDILNGVLPASIHFDGLELVLSSGTFMGGDSFTMNATRNGSRDIDVSITEPESLAFGSPIRTDADLGNTGNAIISGGEVIALSDSNGEPLDLFAQNGVMSPPLGVRFITDTKYEILDFSDPGNPVELDPPIRNQTYIPGVPNSLFNQDPGATFVTSAGDFIGLSAGQQETLFVTGSASPTNNGYPAEVLSFTRPSSVDGGTPTTEQLITGLFSSAKETADMLSNVNGVSATASNYMEITDVENLSLTEPLQITLNGEELIEYAFDSDTSTFVISPAVPNPKNDPDAFNQYIAERINTNDVLKNLGVFASASSDATTGDPELKVYSTEGDDFDLTFVGDDADPDSFNVNDGLNPGIALTASAAGTSSGITIGGTIDLTLADGVTLGANPSDSLLFGDTTSANFAKAAFLGIQAEISGNPEEGDAFTLDFNSDGAFDNRNILSMSNLQTLETIGDGRLSFTGSYGALIEDVGIASASSITNSAAATQVLQQSEELRNSVSGVNLDEEAANLIRFEQLYSANTQVISVARDIFERLLNSF